MKNKIDMKIIETMLVKYKSKPLQKTGKLSRANPIPLTHKGGISDAAIATPARLSDTFGWEIAKAATAPATKAITMSIKVGVVLANTSLVIIFIGENNVIKKAVHSPTAEAIVKTNKALLIYSGRP
jgi:hypothetical protein